MNSLALSGHWQKKGRWDNGHCGYGKHEQQTRQKRVSSNSHSILEVTPGWTPVLPPPTFVKEISAVQRNNFLTKEDATAFAPAYSSFAFAHSSIFISIQLQIIELATASNSTVVYCSYHLQNYYYVVARH